MSNIRPIDDPAVPVRMVAAFDLLKIMPPAKINVSAPTEPGKWIADRFARIAGAIAFLGAQGVAVAVADRHAEIRTYFVSANRRSLFAEEVIEMAIERGWAE